MWSSPHLYPRRCHNEGKALVVYPPLAKAWGCSMIAACPKGAAEA